MTCFWIHNWLVAYSEKWTFWVFWRTAEQEAVKKVIKQQRVGNQALGLFISFVLRNHMPQVTWQHCVIIPRLIIVLLLINLLKVSIRTAVHWSTVFSPGPLKQKSQQKYLIPTLGLDQIAEPTNHFNHRTECLLVELACCDHSTAQTNIFRLKQWLSQSRLLKDNLLYSITS